MEPKANKNDDEEDRISRLPDPILHLIISNPHIDSTCAVRTCILSKRWRNIWISMPNLVFDYNYYSFHGPEAISFPSFVNKVLQLRDKSLDVHSFHLMWCHKFFLRRQKRIDKWMQYAVDHNVKYVEIFLSDGNTFFDKKIRYPSCIFTCPSLENLKINGAYAYFDGVVNLNRLRKLDIEHNEFDPAQLNVLISGCPVLEELHFLRCRLVDSDVSSNSLKKLGIEKCLLVGKRIRVTAPNLQYFNLRNNNFKGVDVFLKNLPSLVKASIQIGGLVDHYDYNPENSECECEYEDDDYDQLLKFVCPKSEVTSTDTLSELEIFPKLEKLELLGSNMLEHFSAVEHFLDRSPNLKLLTLNNAEHASLGPSEILKILYICPHHNICIISKFGMENNEILDLLNRYFSSLCDCGQE